jgi:hypothetical protein
MLASDGEAWIADPYRAAAEDFPQALLERGLSCTVEAVETTSADVGLLRGTLHRVTRKKQP